MGTAAFLEKWLGQEDAAHFLMRCIFTIFAADMGLLPKAKVIGLLEDCHADPGRFVPMFEALWRCLDAQDHSDRFFPGFGEYVPHINGGLFADARAFALDRDGVSRSCAMRATSWCRTHCLKTLARRALGQRRNSSSAIRRSWVEKISVRGFHPSMWKP